MGEPQVVQPRSASLSLATGRIAETDLSKAARSRLDVPGLGVFEQVASCSPLKDSSSPSDEIRFVKTVVSTNVRSSGISTTVKHTTV
jgi:hypothetical protein